MGGDWWWLVLAGVGSGLVGSIAGLASVVSYPALLAYGLPPVAANVTNTTAMMATTAGAAAGSRPELRGQGPRLAVLGLQMALGGAAGAALLLTTPARWFDAVVPWLIAFGAALLLGRDRLRARAEHASVRVRGSLLRRSAWTGALLLVGAYAGYFGAGSGIILLAVLAIRDHEPLPVTNAVKNIGTGVANIVATVAYLAVAPVDLGAALALGAGALVGAWTGPQVVRVLPERPLRYAVAAAGFGLAAWLLLD
ncbi:sulfite exporter TauE/SafE family protein [Nocardioides sp. SYSU DS0663]|uniref:sulfite exporter TauE/SafE family protein n=1 Tax=Nocardioides sp. SYSU DS0663 TaxID=3416445 RepID=UPI003F4B7667